MISLNNYTHKNVHVIPYNGSFYTKCIYIYITYFLIACDAGSAGKI